MPIVFNKESGVMGYKYQGLAEEAEFITKNPLLEPYLEGLAMAYIKCQQFAGIEPEEIRQTPLEQIKEHIFGNNPCPDCRDYMRNLIGLLNIFGEPVKYGGRTIYRFRNAEPLYRPQSGICNPKYPYH